MDYYTEALLQALQLIISLDTEVINIVSTSLKVSISSTIIASVISIPLAVYIARSKFKAKTAVNIILNTLLSLPTVVIGIFVYSLISRRGILGRFELLFTPAGIVIGQVIMLIPLITAMIRNVIFSMDEKLYKTAASLGASRIQEIKLLILEARYGIIGAVIAGFGRVLGEIGISMMLGGNIKGVSRTITTAMSLETSRGKFSFALALGIILLVLSFLINFATYFLQEGNNYARR